MKLRGRYHWLTIRIASLFPCQGMHMKYEEYCAKFLARMLAPVGYCIAGLFGILAVAHSFVLKPEIRLPMVCLAGFTALCLALVSRYCSAKKESLKYVNLLAMVMICLPAANSLTHIFLSGEIKQSTNVAALLIAMGALFYSLNLLPRHRSRNPRRIF